MWITGPEERWELCLEALFAQFGLLRPEYLDYALVNDIKFVVFSDHE